MYVFGLTCFFLYSDNKLKDIWSYIGSKPKISPWGQRNSLRLEVDLDPLITQRCFLSCVKADSTAVCGISHPWSFFPPFPFTRNKERKVFCQLTFQNNLSDLETFWSKPWCWRKLKHWTCQYFISPSNPAYFLLNNCKSVYFFF